MKQLIHSISCGDNIVLFHLWWEETMLKGVINILQVIIDPTIPEQVLHLANYFMFLNYSKSMGMYYVWCISFTEVRNSQVTKPSYAKWRHTSS